MLPKRPDSGKRVLPPISSDGEKLFVKQVESNLQNELIALESSNNSEGEKYTVYRNGFSEVRCDSSYSSSSWKQIRKLRICV